MKLCQEAFGVGKLSQSTASSTGNFKLGIERGNAVNGWARIDDASLATGNSSCAATRVAEPASPDLWRKAIPADGAQRVSIITMQGIRIAVGGNALARQADAGQLRPGAYLMVIESARSARRNVRFIVDR